MKPKHPPTLCGLERDSETDDLAKPHQVPDLQKPRDNKLWLKPLSLEELCYANSTTDN